MKGQRQSHASDRREHAEALVNQTALPQAHGELPDKCHPGPQGKLKIKSQEASRVVVVKGIFQ